MRVHPAAGPENSSPSVSLPGTFAGVGDETEAAFFHRLVDDYYQSLYRFALSLAQSEAEAADLTQQTYYRWATKGHQLRDGAKVKTWLFTTLYREFLRVRQRQSRFVSVAPGEDEPSGLPENQPAATPDSVRSLDATWVLAALARTDEIYRAPLTLFYLQEHSYQEIAAILRVPIGTVMSRLSRGKAQLRARLADPPAPHPTPAAADPAPLPFSGPPPTAR